MYRATDMCTGIHNAYRRDRPGCRSTLKPSSGAAALLCLALSAAAQVQTLPDTAALYRIELTESGVYRIDYEDLQAAGLDHGVPVDWLGMSNLGQPLQLFLEDGGDGQFDPGDAFRFIGRSLREAAPELLGHSSVNVYFLRVGPRTSTEAPPASSLAPWGDGDRNTERTPDSSVHPTLPTVHVRLELEQDRLRVATPGHLHPGADGGAWTWLQLNHLASAPTSIPLPLEGIDLDSEQPLLLSVEFRGGSDHASRRNLKIDDHDVEITLNGKRIGRAAWSGRGVYRALLDGVPASSLHSESNELGLRVVPRRYSPAEETIIDVVQLDRIRVQYPFSGRVDSRQQRVWQGDSALDTDARRATLTLRIGDDQPVEAIRIFGARGAEIRPELPAAGGDSGIETPERFELPWPEGESSLWLVPGGSEHRVARIEAVATAELAARTAPADYFIIAHPALLDAAAPLAEFHRTRGLRTELIDVRDLYREFSFGIRHPEAIRRFLDHARRTREGGPPAYVLLVGDADWFSGADEPGAMGDRDLIPTWSVPSRDGPAASDLPFVGLDPDPIAPSMAIGRLPVATEDEARAVIGKILRYQQTPMPGPWRSRVLLASESGRNFEARNQVFSQQVSAAGLRATKLPENPGAPGSEAVDALVEAFDQGALLLHFYGHGGRFMWQFAAAGGNHPASLFDMGSLDRLQASEALPIVLSMSCATGPFDHPQADSLAEKLLRLDDRGAVAVLSASARNSPSVHFTGQIIEALVRGESLGRAVLEAKRHSRHPDTALYYNLFGDPALVAALPVRPSDN